MREVRLKRPLPFSVTSIFQRNPQQWKGSTSVLSQVLSLSSGDCCDIIGDSSVFTWSNLTQSWLCSVQNSSSCFTEICRFSFLQSAWGCGKRPEAQTPLTPCPCVVRLLQASGLYSSPDPFSQLSSFTVYEAMHAITSQKEFYFSHSIQRDHMDTIQRDSTAFLKGTHLFLERPEIIAQSAMQ